MCKDRRFVLLQCWSLKVRGQVAPSVRLLVRTSARQMASQWHSVSKRAHMGRQEAAGFRGSPVLSGELTKAPENTTLSWEAPPPSAPAALQGPRPQGSPLSPRHQGVRLQRRVLGGPSTHQTEAPTKGSPYHNEQMARCTGATAGGHLRGSSCLLHHGQTSAATSSELCREGRVRPPGMRAATSAGLTGVQHRRPEAGRTPATSAPRAAASFPAAAPPPACAQGRRCRGAPAP